MNKRCTVLAFCLIYIISSLLTANAQEEKMQAAQSNEKNYRIMLNEDNTQFYQYIDENVTVKQIRDYLYQYKNLQVTDFIMNVNGSLGLSAYPSKNLMSFLDKYYQTVENGKSVNYKANIAAKGAYLVYEKLGSDLFGEWIDVMNEIGINPWVSFRMNDCHGFMDQTGIGLTDFWHQRKDLYRVQHRSAWATYDRTFDYLQKDTRDVMLSHIDETLERYDVYGIELDWSRFALFAPIGFEDAGREVLNQFMRDLDAIIKKYEEARQKDIRVLVRIPRDPKTTFEAGFDYLTWADEGLIDIVCPTSQWDTTDNDMPLALWTSLLNPLNVEVIAGMEDGAAPTVPATYAANRKLNHPDAVTGAAAAYYDQGSAGVYLYNFVYKFQYFNRISTDARAMYKKMLSTVGSIETMAGLERRHIVTYEFQGDIFWRKPYRPLPVTCKSSTPGRVRVAIGKIPDGATAIVKLGIPGSVAAGNIKVQVNGVDCTFTRTEECSPQYTTSTLYCFEIPAAAFGSTMYVDVWAVGTSFSVDYTEVTIKP